MYKIFQFFLLFFISILITSCGGSFFKKTDARKISPNPKERVKKNLEEGRGFRINDAINRSQSTNYDFATSNELWRASLDVIDFMPLTTANYSGGIIVTDWYSEGDQDGEFIKITIRFMTNEIRSDAIDVNVFYKLCETSTNCSIKKTDGKIKDELTKNILRKAATYKKQKDEKKFKPYDGVKTE